jgi:hypothetical protein
MSGDERSFPLSLNTHALYLGFKGIGPVKGAKHIVPLLQACEVDGGAEVSEGLVVVVWVVGA